MSELAIIDEKPVSDRAEEQLVTMTVDGQLFGLSILSVQDIVETHAITQVPLAPSAISGIMNLRGRIVTVINLRRILGKTDDADCRMGVTVEYQGDLYTILVDQIGEVRLLDQGDFESAPATLDPILKQLCTGVYRLDGELLAVLDVDQILSGETIAQTPPIKFIARRNKNNDKEKKAIAKKPAADNSNEKAAKANGAAAPDEDEGPSAPKARARKADRPAPPATEPESAEPDMNDADAEAETASAMAEPSCAPAPVEPEAEVPDPAASPAAAVQSELPAGADADESIFEELGGAGVLTGVVESFYEKVLADASLSGFYAGADMDRQMDGLQAFLTDALGGTPENAVPGGHAWLVPKKGLTDDHFNTCLSLFESALQERSVPEGIIFRILAAIELKRESIVD